MQISKGLRAPAQCATTGRLFVLELSGDWIFSIDTDGDADIAVCYGLGLRCGVWGPPLQGNPDGRAVRSRNSPHGATK